MELFQAKHIKMRANQIKNTHILAGAKGLIQTSTLEGFIVLTIYALDPKRGLQAEGRIAYLKSVISVHQAGVTLRRRQFPRQRIISIEREAD